jgi:DNA-binding transcriptional regulator/RsmH inhibitor MraZ
VCGLEKVTEFEKRMIAYADSNHDLCAAMVKELERLNENIEKIERSRPSPRRIRKPPTHKYRDKE